MLKAFLKFMVLSLILYQSLLGQMMFASAPPLDEVMSDLKGAYLSPGVQIGWNMGQGLYWGAQLTIGYDRVGDQEEVYPGITFGFRQMKECRLRYIDFQATFSEIFSGVGTGMYWESINDSKYTFVSPRLKFYSGFFGLVTYDFHWKKNGMLSHNFGAIGIVPIPLGIEFK